MEGKKQNASLGMIAGVLLAVVAVVRLLDVLSILFGWGFFYFEGLLYVAALAFFAVMLIMKRQDTMLLIAVGAHALMVLMIDNPLLVIAALLLAAVVLLLATDFVPNEQAKGWAAKLFFVPAIVALIGGLMSIYSFMALVVAVAVAAAYLLCGMWLSNTDLKQMENDIKEGAQNVAADGQVAEGYCDLFKHALLLMITFGIWQLIWVYRMTSHLNRVKDEPYRNPTNKLLLYIFVPFYAVYWNYKSAQLIDKQAKTVGVKSGITVWCLLLSTIIPFVAMILMQDKVNKILEVESGKRQADFDPAEKFTASVNKERLESLAAYCGLFKHVLLLNVTFGIWQLIWVYRMTGYLNCVEGEPKRDPVKKLLLYIFVPFYSVYWNYKSAQLIDKLAKVKGLESDLVVLTLIGSLVVPVVPAVLLQDKVNEILAVDHSDASDMRQSLTDMLKDEEMAFDMDYDAE